MHSSFNSLDLIQQIMKTLLWHPHIITAMGQLRDYFEHEADVLNHRANGFQNRLDSTTLKGSAGEEILKEFLETILPSSMIYRTGTIVDAISDTAGHELDETDIILYDTRYPILQYGDAQIFLAEGVITNIEIKLSYRNGNIPNARNARECIKYIPQDNPEDEVISEVNSILFCPGGSSKEIDTVESHFLEQFAEWEEGEYQNSASESDSGYKRFDVSYSPEMQDPAEDELLPLNGMCILNDCYFQLNQQSKTVEEFRFEQDSLASFVFHILDMIHDQRNQTYEMKQYVDRFRTERLQY